MAEPWAGRGRHTRRRGVIGPRPALLAWVVALLGVVAMAPGRAQPVAAADAILGNWLTQPRDGIIRISRTADGHYEGRIVGGDSPGRLDTHNPDPARRGERLLGRTILRDMTYVGSGRWSGGTIYDPDSGHTYRCRIEWRSPEQLRVRGFLGISLLGRSQIWTRYLGSSMQLPPHGR